MDPYDISGGNVLELRGDAGLRFFFIYWHAGDPSPSGNVWAQDIVYIKALSTRPDVADKEFGGYDAALFLGQKASRAGEELVFKEPYVVLAAETSRLVEWLRQTLDGLPYVAPGRLLRTSPLAERVAWRLSAA